MVSFSQTYENHNAQQQNYHWYKINHVHIVILLDMSFFNFAGILLVDLYQNQTCPQSVQYVKSRTKLNLSIINFLFQPTTAF